MTKDILMPILVLLVVAAVAVGLFANDGSVKGGGFGSAFSTSCLNGVKYYGDYRTLAPAVDAETLTFIRCEESE